MAGTHGRSVWILGDISALEQLTPGGQTHTSALKVRDDADVEVVR